MSKEEHKKRQRGVRVAVAHLRELRRRKAFTQLDLALAAKVGQRTVEKVEGEGIADASTLERLATALGVSPEELAEPPKEPQEQDGESARLFQLPTALHDFVGRAAQIEELTTAIRGDSTTVGRVSLRGMGGVGKTTLAVKIAHEVRDAFPDAQLFINLAGLAEQPVPSKEVVTRIIRDFRPNFDPSGFSPDALQGAYRTVLNGKRALIVLDNAANEAQVQPLLTAPASIGFLITSRNALALQCVQSHRIDVLPANEAKALLISIVKMKTTEEELVEIVRLCARLPIALRVAGDFLRLHPNWSLNRYIQALSEEKSRLDRLKSKVPPRGELRWEDLDGRAEGMLEVEAVLALSARQLVLEDEALAQQWQLLSIFPGDHNISLTARVWQVADDSALDSLGALLDRSLVQHESTWDRYSLHDLMRPVARNTFEYVEHHHLASASELRTREAERRLSEWCRDYIDALESLYKESGRGNIIGAMTIFDQELTNFRKGWKWAYDNRDHDPHAKMSCILYPLSAPTLIALKLSDEERFSWWTACVKSSRELQDREHEIAALNGFGSTLLSLGHAREAVHYLQEQLNLSKQQGNRDGEIAALGNLARAFAELDEPEIAIQLLEQYLRFVQGTIEGHNVVTALCHLGELYRRTEDAYTAAFYLKQAVVLARQIGDIYLGALASYGFARSLDSLGRRDEAVSFAKYAVVVYLFLDREQQMQHVNQLLESWDVTWNSDIITLLDDPPRVPEDL